MTIDTEHINSLIESQLEIWSEARMNYQALRKAERRIVRVGDLDIHLQHNPERIRSTGAKVDAASIAARPCFLCRKNRPTEQMSAELMTGWELLVNPFPILPVHFTIPATEHRPQGRIPLEMAAMAEMMPDLTFFYNGARAGASAPDHQHCQAVLKSEIPLIALAEKYHRDSSTGFVPSTDFGLDLPFHFYSGIISPTRQGMADLARISLFHGIDAETDKADTALVNAFFWIGDKGMLRVLLIPRRAHRPQCWYADDDTHLTVSPGALDMAGLLILPVKEDYDRITENQIREIYSQTAFSTEPLPELP